jgi:hypothetical protein
MRLTAVPTNIQPQDQNHQKPSAFRVNALDQGPFAGEDLLFYDHRSTLIQHFTAEHYDLGAVAMDKQGGICLNP